MLESYTCLPGIKKKGNLVGCEGVGWVGCKCMEDQRVWF